MDLPCEYCGKPVDGEPFLRMGVAPCCEECVLVPAIVGSLSLVVFLGLIFWAWSVA